jgi:hypothetical protein
VTTLDARFVLYASGHVTSGTNPPAKHEPTIDTT